MDVYFLLQGQRFVWDSEKASSNFSKHGVSFEVASQVFFDPFVRVRDATTDEEQRDAAVGLADDWSLLFVVHVLARRGHNSHRVRASGHRAGAEMV
jgi:uncharacterized DUF497 family protein